MTFSTRSITLALLSCMTACDPVILGDLDPDSAGDAESAGGKDDGEPGPTLDVGGGGGGESSGGGSPLDVGGGGADDSDPSDGWPLDIGADGIIACDLWAQDCGAEEKCMPWDETGGGTWNATRCAPVASDPVPVGEPCLVEGGGTSGIDNCETAAMCFFVDPDTNEGVCVDMCLGAPDYPVCLDPATVCVIDYDGLVNLCLEP